MKLMKWIRSSTFTSDESAHSHLPPDRPAGPTLHALRAKGAFMSRAIFVNIQQKRSRVGLILLMGAFLAAGPLSAAAAMSHSSQRSKTLSRIATCLSLERCGSGNHDFELK
jgi:hypothetical protein